MGSSSGQASLLGFHLPNADALYSFASLKGLVKPSGWNLCLGHFYFQYFPGDSDWRIVCRDNLKKIKKMACVSKDIRDQLFLNSILRVEHTSWPLWALGSFSLYPNNDLTHCLQVTARNQVCRHHISPHWVYANLLLTSMKFYFAVVITALVWVTQVSSTAVAGQSCVTICATEPIQCGPGSLGYHGGAAAASAASSASVAVWYTFNPLCMRLFVNELIGLACIEFELYDMFSYDVGNM
jgi:hypothetical protein